MITSWNPAAQRLYGYSAEEAIGQPIGLIIPEARAGEERQILDKIMSGQRLQHYETERVAKDGHSVHVSLTISPIRDEDDRIVGASVVARDIGDRVRARRRAELLQEVTSALAREAEPEEAMRVLLTAGASSLGADAATLGLIDTTGTKVQIASAHGHSGKGLADWLSFPLEMDLPMCVAIRDLEPVWCTSAEAVIERFPALAEAEFRFSALAVLPLAVEGQPLGAISFSFAKPRQFSAEERAFATAITQQAAFSLERAATYAGERLSRQRLSFLALASEALSESLEQRETLGRLAEISVRHFCEWCSVDLLREDGELENIATSHMDRSKVELAHELRERYRIDPDSPRGAHNVIRTGEAELHPTVPDELLVEAAQDERHLALMRELGIGSAIVVPLTARGRTVGAITFAASNESPAFDEHDLELAEDLGRRAALAIDTSELYQREHETAMTLQRALLPRALPEVPGLSVATRYLPAESGLEVGGDWYDVIEGQDGCVDLLIGDVAGRGVRAASVMGRLAVAYRAYAAGGRPVESAIAAVNELMLEYEADNIATVFVLRLDPSDGSARFVRAGHPPALIRRPDGEVFELEGDPTPPIGWLPGMEVKGNETLLEPGSVVLLYTDGLIERRRLDIGISIDFLKVALSEAPSSPEEIVKQLPARLGAERVPDDIALLAAAVA